MLGCALVKGMRVGFCKFKSANTADKAIREHQSLPTVNIEDIYPLMSCLLHRERKTNTKQQHQKILRCHKIFLI